MKKMKLTNSQLTGRDIVGIVVVPARTGADGWDERFTVLARVNVDSAAVPCREVLASGGRMRAVGHVRAGLPL
jgi:hypothetical protein